MSTMLRKFAIIGHRAPSSGKLNLNDLAGSCGRMDVLSRAINTALFLSHGIREDTEVMLHLMGGPGPARRILFQGSRLRGVYPDERAIAGQIGKALREPVPSIGHFIELHPGFLHSGGNIEQTIIEWKRDNVELCVLDASGELFEPKSHSQEKIGFLLSDDQPFSVNEVEMMENLPVVSLGQKWLQGHSCIAIIHHLMDSQ